MLLLTKFLHLVGMALFFGGALGAITLNRAAGSEAQPSSLDRAHRAIGRLADWGSVLSFLSGGYLMHGEGIHGAAFGQAGWLQIMIALALVATAVSGIAGGKLRRALKQPPEGGMARVRGTLAVLRQVQMVSVVGAVVCGVWRFYW